MMNNKQVLGAGLGLGTGMMYFCDPDRGRRRRARVRDAVIHMAHVTGHAIGITRRDLGHWVAGFVSDVRSLFSRDSGGDPVVTHPSGPSLAAWSPTPGRST
jgi:hypothetical protein